jgi:hypothetical protein
MVSLKELYGAVPIITFNPLKWGAGGWAVVIPLILHWVQCAAYETFGHFGWFQQYKMLQPEEFEKNKVTKWQVVRSVLLNHTIMMVIGFMASELEGDISDQPLDDPLGITQAILQFADNSEWSLVRHWPAGRFFVHAALFLARLSAAIVVYDTWQFWAHYVFHTLWLYRKSMKSEERVSWMQKLTNDLFVQVTFTYGTTFCMPHGPTARRTFTPSKVL